MEKHLTGTAQALTAIEEPTLIGVGVVATLTEGQGKGSSEDKRRAYN